MWEDNNNCGLELETLTFAVKKMDESRSDEEFNDGMDGGKVMEGSDVDQETVASGGGEGAERSSSSSVALCPEQLEPGAREALP